MSNGLTANVPKESATADANNDAASSAGTRSVVRFVISKSLSSWRGFPMRSGRAPRSSFSLFIASRVEPLGAVPSITQNRTSIRRIELFPTLTGDGMSVFF